MHRSKKIRDKDIMIWVNIAFFGMAVLLFFYYIIMANSITSKSYTIQELRSEVGELVEMNGSLMSQKFTLEDPISLAQLAQAHNLVEARNVVYIFESRNVALQK